MAARRAEIEGELIDRLTSVVNTDHIDDPEYIAGLRASIPALFEYAISSLSHSGRHTSVAPTVLLAQARLAARNGLPLHLVIRRCAACRTLIEKVLVEAAEQQRCMDRLDLSGILRTVGLLFERLMDAVSEVHTAETKRVRSGELHRVRVVRDLLAGEFVTSSDLGYELGAHHIAVIAHGANNAKVIRRLAEKLDCVSLLIPNRQGATWAWLGRNVCPTATQLDEVSRARWPATVSIAIGEPGHGLPGWRRSHRQASAAFPLAIRHPGKPVRYAEDPILFSALRDDLLSGSLHDLYLAPLLDTRDGGVTLLKTLRAYFAAGRNGASAAAALGVRRQTVMSRLRTVEKQLGRSVTDCATALEATLRLADFNGLGNGNDPPTDCGTPVRSR